MDNVLKGLELVEAKATFSIYVNRKTDELFIYDGLKVEQVIQKTKDTEKEPPRISIKPGKSGTPLTE